MKQTQTYSLRKTYSPVNSDNRKHLTATHNLHDGKIHIRISVANRNNLLCSNALWFQLVVELYIIAKSMIVFIYKAISANKNLYNILTSSSSPPCPPSSPGIRSCLICSVLMKTMLIPLSQLWASYVLLSSGLYVEIFFAIHLSSIHTMRYFQHDPDFRMPLFTLFSTSIILVFFI